MTQTELFDKCLQEIAVDVEQTLRTSMRETIIDGAGEDHVHRNVIGVFEHNKAKYLRMLLNKPEEEPMTVLSAEIGRHGTTIKFITTNKVKEGDLFRIIVKERSESHYFLANGIGIAENGLLKIDATETGYYVRKFDRMQDFDMRTIIGLSITPIVDEGTIRRIHEESCWC